MEGANHSKREPNEGVLGKATGNNKVNEFTRSGMEKRIPGPERSREG